MKCAVHPEVDATGFCRNCGKPMCPACVRPVRDVLYCEDCLAQVMGIPAPQPVRGAPGTCGLPGQLHRSRCRSAAEVRQSCALRFCWD